jgi:hypothetical protein
MGQVHWPESALDDLKDLLVTAIAHASRDLPTLSEAEVPPEI